MATALKTPTFDGLAEAWDRETTVDALPMRSYLDLVSGAPAVIDR